MIKTCFYIFLLVVCVVAQAADDKKKSDNTLHLEKMDSFYDPETNYSEFGGRVTDRDESTNVLKISSENTNTKFFRAGDRVDFTPMKGSTDRCTAYVRDVEDTHFVVFVKDLHPCWKEGEFFRRGTLLHFYSDVLAGRVKDASQFRMILLQRREDFLRQLNSINHFVWTFDQQKVITASEYDEKINLIKEERQKALNELVKKKDDNLRLQRELMVRLDELDNDLEHFRIEKIELFTDRWSDDQDTGAPVGNRPQKVKEN